MLKKILLAVLIVLIVIQFIHPKKNQSTAPQPYNVETKYPMSAEVKAIMQKACNDCHSNNTVYPWYSKLQPIDWMLAKHVVDGKKHLNFDEFTNKPAYRQYRKLEEVAEQIKEGEMPLQSYTITHKDAILTDAEKEAVYAWVNSARATMEVTFPKDSLQRPKGQASPKS